ncbi:MAG: glycine--tRNA ligase subunit beta [Candidatus Eisenbacteria bacterium]|uniref:Glycine--tRNA ligase beta subunit n=1 Tax=Eiseniibacteriota bacterium TaxID=2212470 RepID=A0A849SLT1_UNCEI|nr:glycine--tRNA ligase subunit beta [Candidatus Eisenbacteria bacterium]
MIRDLLFEIGVEEIPAGYVPPALEQIEVAAHAMLRELRLTHGAIETWGTPRRLVLSVRAIADRQPDLDEELMGPAVKAAFDAEGKPTKALLGFCTGRGVDVSQVRRVETPKGEYVAVTVHRIGQHAIEVLPAALATLATRIQFPKSMRWLDDDTRFARPVRWLLCLLGADVVPVQAFQLVAGRITYGHRFLAPAALEVIDANAYSKSLESVHVIVDHAARSARLGAAIDSVASAERGRVVVDPELIEINNFQVERATVFAGHFDARYLDLPREVIITALREHQRFFSVEDANGALMPLFLAVRNGDERGLEFVRKGNQDVLVARLEDARFYWDTDLKHAPAERVSALDSVVWMEGLGTLREKAARLDELATWLAARLAPATTATVQRAALLCKTDLLGEMIGSGKEYASLEGVMGGHYARRAGEPEAVAVAIAEHYRPRGASDALPSSEAGAVLSLADKLDHIAGAFVAGKIPSGSEDPYGVRRAANGALRLLIERGWNLDLRAATMEMTRVLFAADPELAQAEIVKKLGEFWRGRVDAALEERGIAYDTREAALEAQIVMEGAPRPRPGWVDPSDCLTRARTLAAFRSDPRFEPLVVLFKRVANILTKSTETLPPSLDAARLTEPAERELLAALERARKVTAPLWEKRGYDLILPELLGLETAIHGFFDAVMVNAEDAGLRLNRLRLLSEVRDLFLRGWDLSRIVVEGERSA